MYKKQKGITLIALVITIIVLLILAGVSLSLTLGENGILTKAREARIEAEIAEEKEFIQLAYADAKMNSKVENRAVLLGDIQKNLDSSIGKNKTLVTDCVDGFDILIIEKNRYYTQEDDSLFGPEDLLNEKYPGDITKNNEYDGTAKEKAYQINCIEDLVKFSEMSKNGNNFAGKYVALNRNLNFKSKYSYSDYTTTIFGNLNGDDTDGNELYTEMTSGTGFTPIQNFFGYFDGQSYWIKNIYENYPNDQAGLFKYISREIKNINITGRIIGKDNVGSIACSSNSEATIINCNNYANIEGKNNVGGIMGNYSVVGHIINCTNHGNVSGADSVGGILGHGGCVENCVNYGVVSGIVSKAGGIVGHIQNAAYYIKNSYNTGNVSGVDSVGGIAGICDRYAYVVNSYNVGSVTGTNYIGGIIGLYGPNWNPDNGEHYCDNCYNAGATSGTTNVGGVMGLIGAGNTYYYKNMYYLKGTAEKGLGNKDDESGKVEVKEVTALKADAMITTLNTNNSGSETIWYKDTNNKNNGYPILSWQK